MVHWVSRWSTAESCCEQAKTCCWKPCPSLLEFRETSHNPVRTRLDLLQGRQMLRLLSRSAKARAHQQGLVKQHRCTSHAKLFDYLNGQHSSILQTHKQIRTSWTRSLFRCLASESTGSTGIERPLMRSIYQGGGMPATTVTSPSPLRPRTMTTSHPVLHVASFEPRTAKSHSGTPHIW